MRSSDSIHRSIRGDKAAECPRLLWEVNIEVAPLPMETVSIATKRLRTRPSFFCGANPHDSSARSWGLS